MFKEFMKKLACCHPVYAEKPSDNPLKFFMFECTCCKKKKYTMRFEDRPVNYK